MLSIPGALARTVSAPGSNSALDRLTELRAGPAASASRQARLSRAPLRLNYRSLGRPAKTAQSASVRPLALSP
jgi:hypothetical protein